MIDTIEEDNENSPLEYLITGAVVLFFGGLYYYINHGSQYDVNPASLASGSHNTPSISSPPSLLGGAAGLAVAANRPDLTTKSDSGSDTTQNQSTDDTQSPDADANADTAAQNKLAAEESENTAKLKAEELAALEAKKSQLEGDVAKLEADKQKLMDTNTSLAAQADASLEKIEQAQQAAVVQAPQESTDTPQADSSQANSPDGKVYMLPDGRKVDVADKGFEGLLKQALNEKVVDTPIIFDGIYFESGSAEPNQQSQDQILATTALINTHKDVNILIKGHSDDTGDTKANTVLSLTRSNYMKNALVELGIDARRIKVEGVGSLEPIAPNNTPEGRNSNRRIELILLN